jgi:hypothetical protein
VCWFQKPVKLITIFAILSSVFTFSRGGVGHVTPSPSLLLLSSLAATSRSMVRFLYLLALVGCGRLGPPPKFVSVVCILNSSLDISVAAGIEPLRKPC